MDRRPPPQDGQHPTLTPKRTRAHPPPPPPFAKAKPSKREES